MLFIPPGTGQQVNTGFLKIECSLQYLNIDKIVKQTCQLALQMWGYPSLIIVPQKQQAQPTRYSIEFKTSTTLKKLTSYFNDMGVLIVYIVDSRTDIKHAIGYCKLRKYIINGLISNIQSQQIPIYPYSNQSKAKQIIGMIEFTMNANICQQPQKNSIIPYQPQNNVDPFKQPPKPPVKASQRNLHSNRLLSLEGQVSTRKLLEEPHIFDPIDEQHQYHEFNLNKNTKKQLQFVERDPINQKGDRKRRAQIESGFQQSPKEYKTLDELKEKYGRNNPNLEKMKIKLDQIHLLDNLSGNLIRNQYNLNQPEEYALYITNIKSVPPAGSPINDLQIQNLRELPNGQECSILKISVQNANNLQNSPIFLGMIQLHNILEFETKLFKARYQIRETMLTGQPKKIYLKKKENNKKCVEMEIRLKKLHSQNQHQQQALANDRMIQKKHDKKLQYCVELVRQNPSNPIKIFVGNAQPFYGNKLIFTADDQPQKIMIADDFTHSCEIFTNADIVMREEIIKLGKQSFMVRIYVAGTTNQLLSLTKNMANNIEPHNYAPRPSHSQNNKQYQERANPHDSNLIKQDKTTGDRRTKLQCLIKCFQGLSISHNSQCHEIIDQLLELSEGQELNEKGAYLFQKLCQYANIRQPQLSTKSIYIQLFHQQFSMFWKCFSQYQKWNKTYTLSLLKYRKLFTRIIKQGLYIPANSNHAQGSIKENSVREHRNGEQADRLISKLIHKIQRKKEVLFGLIDIQICFDTIYNFLIDNLTSSGHSIEQVSAVKSSAFNFKQIINDLLTLLNNRYGPSKIKIKQLQQLLSKSTNIMLNEHQLSFIYQRGHGQYEKQLLEQVIRSCGLACHMSSNNDKHKYLYDILSENQNLESSVLVSSQTFTQNENEVLFTEYKKYLTEENEDNQWNQSNIGNRRPDAIDRSNKNKLVHQQHHQLKSQPSQPFPIQSIAFCFRSVNINTDEPNPQKTISLQIIDSQQLESPISIVKQSQLPIAVTLKSEHEYILNIIDDQQQQKSLLCFGLFVASKNLKSILLYSKGNESEVIGHVDVGFIPKDKEQQQIENQDEIVLQVHEKEEKQIPEINLINSKRLQEIDVDIIKEKPQGKCLKNIPKIRYEILKVTGHTTSTYQILIEGSMIEYPQENSGILTNHSQQFINVDVIRIGKQKLPLIEGVHQICMLASDMTVRCVLQIQLSEYYGFEDQVKEEQILQEQTAKVIILNLYHFQSMNNFFQEDHQQEGIYDDECKIQLQVIISTQSMSQPIYAKKITISPPNTKVSEDNYYSFSKNRLYNQSKQTLENEMTIRTIQLNLTTLLSPASHPYLITVYKKRCQNSKSSKQLLATFSFSFYSHPNQIGIFQNKGYLIDEKGHRLGMNTIEINYDDIFSKDAIGRSKFENLLTIFEAENIIKINRSLKASPESLQLKKAIRNYFGFSQSEIYTLFELQHHAERPNHFLRMFTEWDVFLLEDADAINMKNYSLKDMFQQYRLFDFKGDGLLPESKAEIVNKIVLPETPIPLRKIMTHKRKNWVIDHHSKQEADYLDYLLILYNLKKFAKFDNFYSAQLKMYGGFNEENNQTIINALSEHKKPPLQFKRSHRIIIKVKEFRNLRIDGKSATLIFYVNGIKMFEPILRCSSHRFQQPNSIFASYPLILEIKNKVYGYKDRLYEEQSVLKQQITSQNIRILDGEVIFLIMDASEYKQENETKEFRRQQLKKKEQEQQMDVTKWYRKQRPNSQERQFDESRATNLSRFRQSRKQKWLNLKQSRNQTNKIKELLSKTSQV